MSYEFQFHQVLHGYGDGHQLLAASLELSRESQSQLLIMSDLAGPGFRDGYESYLTGYALSGSTFYCIGRTWFAPEMPRPGCVWTHTLLVRNEDLARIGDLRALNNLFRRPDLSFGLVGYDEPIFSTPLHADEPIDVTGSARDVLRALYTTDRMIILPSALSVEHESLILGIMNQQWPRLRRSFRFSTGSLTIRESEFDICVCPPEVTHSADKSDVVIASTSTRPVSTERWLDFALRATGSQNVEAEYRRFLWDFGPDYSQGRRAYRPLTEIYLLLSAPESISGDNILSAIADFFPSPDESFRLKKEFLGVGGRYLVRVGGELTALRLLISHPSAGAIPASVAAVGTRARELAQSDMAAACDLALLSIQIQSAYAQEFIDGFLSSATWSDEFIRSAPLALVMLILSREPSIITRSSLWARSDHMSFVGRYVSALQDTSFSLDEVLSAMIQSRAWDAVVAVGESFEEEAFAATFLAIDRSEEQAVGLPDNVYSFLVANSQLLSRMMRDGRIKRRGLAVVSCIMDSRAGAVRAVPIRDWLQASKLNLEFGEQARQISSAVFFLAIALDSRNPEGGELASGVFVRVYDAAINDMIDGSKWQELEPRLSWYIPSRDRCSRLIKTVAKAFKERPWPVVSFFQTFENSDMFKRALSEIDGLYGGYSYIRALKTLSREELGASQRQYKLLTEFS